MLYICFLESMQGAGDCAQYFWEKDEDASNAKGYYRKII